VNLGIKLSYDCVYTRISPKLPKALEDLVWQEMSYIAKEDEYVSRVSHYSSDDLRRSVFDRRRYTIPTGLLTRLMNILDDQNIEYELDRRMPLSPTPVFNGEAHLYEHQAELVRLGLYHKRGILESPTGSGKSVITASLAKHLPGCGIVTVPTVELLYQTQKQLERWTGEKVGIIGDGEFEVERINVGIVLSLNNRAASDPAFTQLLATITWVINDECHKTSNPTHWGFSQHLKACVYKLGLSATPWRNDGLDMVLYGALGEVIGRITPDYLISAGYLVEPEIRFIPIPSLGKTLKGCDWQKAYKLGVVENPLRNQVVVEKALDAIALGRGPVLILVKQIRHGDLIQQYFAQQGYTAPFVHGGTAKRKRETIVEEFKAGSIPILIASVIFDTGVDVPIIQTLIVASGGTSDIETIQRIGRAIRTSPGKDRAYIFEFLDADSSFLKKHALSRQGTLKAVYPGYVYQAPPHPLKLSWKPYAEDVQQVAG
jgi:superfamily II DNA or RNA helicase